MWSSRNEKECLMHWGVPKMQWGVRRYQYEDGTRTPLGLARERAARAANKAASSEGVMTANAVRKGAEGAKSINRAVGSIRRKSNTEDVSKISDEELKKRVNRMNLEQQYADLNSRKVGKGESYVNDALDIIGGVASITASALTIALVAKKLKGG